MLEYISEAIVLDRMPAGDIDSRFSIFTKRFGKFIARAKSARKITSKLSGHLEPGFMVRARFVEKNGLQIVDAIKTSRLGTDIKNLYFLDKILHEAEPDAMLWRELLSDDFSWPRILQILGWDPKEAICCICDKREVVSFGVRNQDFFCMACSSKLSHNGLLYI